MSKEVRYLSQSISCGICDKAKATCTIYNSDDTVKTLVCQECGEGEVICLIQS